MIKRQKCHPPPPLPANPRMPRKRKWEKWDPAAFSWLALITANTPLLPPNLRTSPRRRQQPRWKAPSPHAGEGEANNGRDDSLQRNTLQNCLLPHGLAELLKETAAPFSLFPDAQHLPPLAALMGNRFGGKRQQGTRLSKKGRALCSTQASNLIPHGTGEKPFNI